MLEVSLTRFGSGLAIRIKEKDMSKTQCLSVVF